MNSLVDCDNGNDKWTDRCQLPREWATILGGPPHWGNLAFSGQENKLNPVEILYTDG